MRLYRIDRGAGQVHPLAYVTALALAGAVSSSALACSAEHAVSAQVGLVNEDSVWEEFSSSGARLLKESGRLSGPSGTLEWQCNAWTLQAGMAYASGTRNYDGQTNTGTPLQTTSAIARWSGSAQAMVAVVPAWRLGARLTGVSISRDIASTATASGYPEYYEWRMLSVGTDIRQETTLGTLAIGLWWGQTTDSAMRVQLPGRDVAWLELGPIEQGALEMAWQRAYGAQWTASLGLGYRWTNIGQGKPGVIRSNGVATGVAYQPRVRITEVPLSVSVAYRF